MDPVTVAAVTAGVVALGNKVVEGAAKKIGEDVWAKAKAGFGKVKSLLALKSEAGSPGLGAEVQRALEAKPELAKQVQEDIKHFEVSTGQALVGSVILGQGAVNVIANQQGGLTQTFNFGKS